MAANRWERLLAVGLAIGLGGCAGMKPRRWDGCAIAGAVVGGAAGGAGAGVGLTQADGNADGTSIAFAAVGGTLVGAAVGAVLGHVLCDPVVEEAPPPPPPAPPPPPPAPKKIETLHGPQFDFNKATLRPAGQEKLDHVVRVMQENSNLRVSADGYTDSIGSDAYNEGLSRRRAEAVQRYLVGKGIEASRITVRGLGKANPVASNETAEGRAENRRVEIVAQ